MTLADVAAKQREDARWNDATERLVVIAAFESDPDFDLRTRIETLAATWEGQVGRTDDASEFARRLREALK